MTQALLGNLNNILSQQNLAENLSGLKSSIQTTTSNNQGTNFQQLFDKQNAKVQDSQSGSASNNLQGTLGSMKENVTNNISDFVKNAGEKITQAASVDNVYQDIQDLMAMLNPENSDENSDNTETAEATDSISEVTDNAAIISTIQNMIQPQQAILQNNDNTDEVEVNLDDELSVTLNGKDLDSFLSDFGINNAAEEEVAIVKPAIQTDDADAKSLEELVDEDTLKELNIESIEVETSNDDASSDDFMQNQTPEEHGIKAMLNTQADFAEIKTDMQTFAQAAQKPSQVSQTTPDKIIEQVSKQMENLQNGSRVNLIMNPESLGKVSIQLINTEEGLSAQFTVATQDAKNLIMKGLDGLKETLLAHGVNVDNVTVKMNEAQGSEYNADWTEQEGSRGGNKEQKHGRQDESKENFEQMMSLEEDNTEHGNV